MSFYRNRVYPHIVSVLGNPEPIHKIRQQIVPLAQGTVLEVGVGPGVNFAYYDPAKIDKVYALEPNQGMRGKADKQRRRTKLNVELHDSRRRGGHSGDCPSFATTNTFPIF